MSGTSGLIERAGSPHTSVQHPDICFAVVEEGPPKPRCIVLVIGHIPWAKPSDWTIFKKKENRAEWITASDSTAALKKLGANPKQDQYFYCQSGVRSTQALFTFYLLGWSLSKLHNYDSSWIGWTKDLTLPIATGVSSDTTVLVKQ